MGSILTRSVDIKRDVRFRGSTSEYLEYVEIERKIKKIRETIKKYFNLVNKDKPSLMRGCLHFLI